MYFLFDTVNFWCQLGLSNSMSFWDQVGLEGLFWGMEMAIYS